MSAIHLKAYFFYSDGTPAANVHVTVHEPRTPDYDLGQTDNSGLIDKDIRDRRQITVRKPWNPRQTMQVDDPRDQPLFNVTVTDHFGSQFTSPAFPYNALPNGPIVLPPSLKPDTPSNIADHSLHGPVDDLAPGREFLVRKSGDVWAHAAHGMASLLPPIPMTNGTVIQVGSVSKSLCATAIVAMVEDWSAIRAAVAQLGTGTPQASQTLTFTDRTSVGRQNTNVGTVQMPNVLAPLLANRAAAQEFVANGFETSIPSSMAQWITRFANDVFVHVSPVPAVPPGHFGLLKRVMQGQGAPPPAWSDPFLPLIQGKVAAENGGSFQLGPGIDLIAIQDLLLHNSTILTDDDSGALPGWSALMNEPIDGSAATMNLWGLLKLLLSQPAETNTKNILNKYKNNNYRVLGGIIEACAEIDYDDFVVNRLLHDPRFDMIRRYVVDQAPSAMYYSSHAPHWTVGIPMPDYRNFSADGGFYATASQITDWMHALFTLQPVSRVTGDSAPMVLADGKALLFAPPGSPPFFSGGSTRNFPKGVFGYMKNGSAGLGGNVVGGSVNAEIAVMVGPGTNIYTAFFAGNGNFDADTPFFSALNDLVNSPGWD